MTRENWIAMTENDLLPDFVVSLEDEEAPTDYLLTRFMDVHKLPSQSGGIASSEASKDGEVIVL